MSPRRSLRFPILLAAGMIALVAVLTVGWVLLSVFGAFQDDRNAPLYWTFLSLGAVFLGLLLAGVVIYLILAIKAIRLTQRQSNFIDSVTHELKSPLASMKLSLQTLRRHRMSPEQNADFYQFMLDDLERLDRLTNRMLAVAQLDSEERDGDQEAIELADLLRETAALVCDSYHLPRETVAVQGPAIRYQGQRAELELVFRNLIDNAVKYAGAPPQVRVSAGLGLRGEIVVRVIDNGRGVPRALRRKIFGRFFRIGSELEREKPGTGLGLHIVRTLVRRLRGNVSVRDSRADEGAVFEVRLPRRPVAGAERAQQAEAGEK